jgi:formamidopyrimidine-DNA glycosylase
MPELPEVESLRKRLEAQVAGRRIQAVEAPDSPRFHDLGLAVGGCIRGIDRRGKFLIFHLGERDLIVHLGLTGWLCVGPENRKPPHVRAALVLDGPERLYFEDARRLGRLYVVPAGQLPESHALAEMGPEPLTPGFGREYLEAAIAGSGASIKASLMDQTVVAGLGNTYSDEALFRAGIHPSRRHLSPREAGRVHAAIEEVVREAVTAGGIEDGRYRLRVHRRRGMPCPACGTAIATRRIAGRTSYFCPRCQPAV